MTLLVNWKTHWNAYEQYIELEKCLLSTFARIYSKKSIADQGTRNLDKVYNKIRSGDLIEAYNLLVSFNIYDWELDRVRKLLGYKKELVLEKISNLLEGAYNDYIDWFSSMGDLHADKRIMRKIEALDKAMEEHDFEKIVLRMEELQVFDVRLTKAKNLLKKEGRKAAQMYPT